LAKEGKTRQNKAKERLKERPKERVKKSKEWPKKGVSSEYSKAEKAPKS
jgi:hypothetical protein